MKGKTDWPVILLGDAGEIAAGITLGRKTRNADLISIPYLRVANVQDGFLNLQDIKTIEATRREAEKWRLRAGDILLTEGGDLDKLGRGTCWSEELPECIHQNHIFRVRLPHDRFFPEFVSAQLASNYGKAYFRAHAKKTTGIASINQKVLGGFPLKAPPIAEQRRIAAHLKEQLAAVDTARTAVAAQQTEVTNLANAYIRASLANGATRRVRLGELLDEVKTGIGAAWRDYPVLGATRAGLAPAKEPVGKSPERYKPVRHGTVFYNPMRILIGSIAMVDLDDAPGITSPDYVAVTCRPGRLDYRWFYYWLRSPMGERYIASLARGAVRERMLFNRLVEGELEIPDWETQRKTSQALAELSPLRATLDQRLAEIEKLPSRLLAQAFDG